MKLAIICDTSRFSSRIQFIMAWLFEGDRCTERPYHAAWYDSGTDEYFDMNWRFRVVPGEYYGSRTIYYFEPPAEMLRSDIEPDVGRFFYGVLDVLLFPVLKIFNANAPGWHCSEIINKQLRRKHGNITPWRLWNAPPSPCSMLKWAQVNLKEWHIT